MGLVVLVLLLAVVVGTARGGSLSSLADVRLRAVAALPAAAACQLAAALLGDHLDGRVAMALYAASLLLAGLVVARNVTLPGFGLLGLGLLLNAAVTLTNAAMPVSLHAAERAGAATAALRAGDEPSHEVADRRTRLALLGDVVPLALPPHREVVSVGDVAVAAGLGLYVLVAMGSQSPLTRRSRWTTRVRESTTRGSYS